MGAGKTTLADLLAQRWGVAVRDTDADIVAAQGREISDIFVDDGEAAFRALEREAVARALAEHDGVLSLGGGAVLDEDTRALLAEHTVVKFFCIFFSCYFQCSSFLLRNGNHQLLLRTIAKHIFQELQLIAIWVYS